MTYANGHGRNAMHLTKGSMDTSDTKARVSVPPEWAPQKAIWTAWPADADEWNGDLETPRRDVAALIRALRDAGNTVRLLVNGAEAEASARAAVGDAAELVPAAYGDIWLRDTGPIFARGARWRRCAPLSHQQLGREIQPARRRDRGRRCGSPG